MAASSYSVALAKLAKSLNLKLLYAPCSLEETRVNTSEVIRPGLLLTGYMENNEPNRLQILGNAEMSYLNSLDKAHLWDSLERLFCQKPPAVIVTRSLPALPEMLENAKKYGVVLLSSAESTSDLTNGVISILSVDLAQRISRHGVLVEVYGEGILILGDSGVGKSETAVELLKRGHRLIADDLVELLRVSNRTIVGRAPENIRHFIELRGIGIINVARVFGTGAVKISEKVDLVIELEQWEKGKSYSRTGLEQNTIDIMGLKVPLSVIPVMPGRNLAVIVEIAAISNRQKSLGYNAAQELLTNMGITNDITTENTSVL